MAVASLTIQLNSLRDCNLPWPKMGQVAERLGSRAINQKVVGSIPGRAMLRCVLGENVPVLTVSRSGLERLLNVNVSSVIPS